ncbi:hypothetical protein Tco_0600311 [Tanacetum coccineum]|uniref:Retrovirus-related Pol polyprotein from transposon TNT 1-94 n=1 Tax=Tanacetum coccineum TaxID=301880 RepID=A0ABQ4WBE4_9ASTR
MPTEMELTLEQTQQGVSYKVSMEILLDPTSNKLMVGSIYTDQRGTVVIATIFDKVTMILSSISVDYQQPKPASTPDDCDKVLKLKNFKKDAALKLFKVEKSRKVLKITFSHSRQAKEQAQDLKSMITTSIHKLMIEVKDYELKTKVLKRLRSIFTLVYAVVQKLKKDSWKELQFSLAEKRLLYGKRNKAISLGNVTSKVGIEVHQLSLKDCTNTNHVKDFELASLFGKLKYEANLIDNIYETEKRKSLISATSLSTAFLTTYIVQDFQDSPDDEEDTRNSHEYLNDLEKEYQARALLAKSKRFFKKGTQKIGSAKATDLTKCHKCGKKEEVSSDDNEVTEVKALMALTDEERVFVGKEKQRNYLLSKHINIVNELNTCKEQLLVLKQAKLNLVTMRHVNTEILKENQNLRNELKELTSITEAWLNSSNKDNKCNSEQIPTQKKKILGIDQLTEDTSSFRPKDPVFVKTSAADESSVCSTLLPPLEKLPGVVPCKRTNHRTCDHADFISYIDINQYHTSQSKSSSRSRPSRPAMPLPSYIHCGYNDLQSDDCVYYPICEICGSYYHDTHGHNRIISLKEESNIETLNTSQRTIKHVVAILIPHLITMTLSGSGKEKLFKLRKLSLSKQDIEFHLILTQYQLADIFTKPLDELTLKRLIVKLVGVKTFRNAIGAHYLPHSSEYVAPPSINLVRLWYETIGYGEIVPAKGNLKKSLLPPRWSYQALPMLEGFPKAQSLEAKPGHKKHSSLKTSSVSSKEATKGTGPHVLADQTKSVSEVGKNLAKLVSHVQPSFKDLDSLEMSCHRYDDSDEDKEDEVHATTNFTHSLPTELKDLPSKFNELNEEVKGLKKQVHELEIELPRDFKEILTKLEDFTKTVASVQAKLKSLDALLSLLLNVTKALNKPEQTTTKTNNNHQGTSKSQPKSTAKSAQVEETVFEAGDTQGPQNLGEDTGNTDEPPVVNIDLKDWFKKPERPPTSDPEWNKGKSVENKPTQKGLSDLAKEEKPSRTFVDFMSTLIDFSAFVMNHLQISELTQYILVGLAYNILKDWNNPEGDRYPFDLSKPPPLVMSRNCQIIPVDYFFNNDLAYLQGGSTGRTYTTSLTKTMAGKYDYLGIEDMAGITDLNPYSAYSNPQGFIYVDKLGRNRLMCSHELYKFSDGTLISLYDTLKDMANNLEMGYTSVMPRRR